MVQPSFKVAIAIAKAKTGMTSPELDAAMGWTDQTVRRTCKIKMYDVKMGRFIDLAALLNMPLNELIDKATVDVNCD